MGRQAHRWFVLVLAAVLVQAAVASSNSSECSFVQSSPRYAALRGQIQLTGVEQSELLGGAVVTALETGLGLGTCAIQLSTASSCDTGAASAACSNPFYVCENQVLDASLFELAVTGGCASAAQSQACAVLALAPGLSAAVQADECQAACVLTETGQLLGGPDNATLDDSSANCSVFDVQLLAADAAAATALGETLTSASMAAALVGAVASYATSSTQANASVTGASLAGAGCA